MYFWPAHSNRLRFVGVAAVIQLPLCTVYHACSRCSPNAESVTRHLFRNYSCMSMHRRNCRDLQSHLAARRPRSGRLHLFLLHVELISNKQPCLLRKAGLLILLAQQSCRVIIQTGHDRQKRLPGSSVSRRQSLIEHPNNKLNGES